MSRRRPGGPVTPSPQFGLTLVEVMVAMAVGIILLLALGTLFANSTRIFKANDDFSRMQENGAYALNTIGADLRMAGFYGYLASNSVDIPAGASITMTSDCGPNWAITFGQPLAGFFNVSASEAHTKLACIPAANFITTAANRPSFILIVRGAAGGRVLPAALDAATVYVQSDAGGGIAFYGKEQYDGLAVTAKRYLPGGSEAPIFPYHARAYYLRPCSRPTGTDGVCLASDDGNQPIPTLVRQELVGTIMTERAVAEGIEAARILYGVDNGGDGIPDIYTEAPTAAQFSQVVTVRVSVLVRSPQPANGYDDSSRSYDVDGDGTPELNCTADALPCNYHRHVFTQSFQVRNVAQRLETF